MRFFIEYILGLKLRGDAIKKCDALQPFIPTVDEYCAPFIGGGPSDTKFGGERGGKVILVIRAEKMGNECKERQTLKREIHREEEFK